MAVGSLDTTDTTSARPARGLALQGQRRVGSRSRLRVLRNGRSIFAIGCLLTLYLLALFAPLIAPYDPNAQVLMDRLQPPSTTHFFGTDPLGRDIFSRALYAGRISLSLSLVAVTITLVVGAVVGLASGYAGGLTDSVLMRISDVFLAFPVFILLITVISIFGSSIPLLIIFLGLSAWPHTARTVRAEVLSLRNRDYVEAARVSGASVPRILFTHLLPNVVSVLVVAGTLRVASLILIEAALSYFGLGVTPPTPTWGNMVTEGRLYLDTAWWVTTIPGLIIVATVLAYNLLGDSLRDMFDPRRRG